MDILTTTGRGPTDGAMISPYGEDRDFTASEASAWGAIERAEKLCVQLKRELALAMSLDSRVDTALQDAYSAVQTLITDELPGAKRAIGKAE